jgi:hypothetical protein
MTVPNMRFVQASPKTKLLTWSLAKDARVRKKINVHIAVMDYGFRPRTARASRTRGSGKPVSATLGRFACGWRRFGSFSTADRTLIRLIWVILAPGRFAAKTPDSEGWISLDSLVRI